MTLTIDPQQSLGANIDRFILEHLSRLEFTRPVDVPASPTGWVLDKFDEGMDAGYLLATIYGLAWRGVSPADCARYIIDERFELPFLGTERAVFDVTISAMRERGVAPMEIAQALEYMGLAIEGIHRLTGLSCCPERDPEEDTGPVHAH